METTLVSKLTAAERLSVSPQTVARLIKHGHLTAHKLGTRVAVTADSLEAYITATAIQRGGAGDGVGPRGGGGGHGVDVGGRDGEYQGGEIMNAIQNAAAPNPWVVKESKTFTPLPSGAYIAKFTGVEDVKLPSGDDRWRWTWEVTTGEHKGQRADALTEQSISPNALAGRLLAGLLRRPLAAGENVQAAIAAAVGQADLVTIAAGPKGGSKGGVKTVNALPM